LSASDDDQSNLLLVTGASGFVGGHVVDEAIAQGWKVRALVRRESNFRRLQKQGAEVVEGALVDLYSLKGAMRGVTHVVHCAAKVGDWGNLRDYRDTNVGGLERMLEAALEAGSLKRFVHLSSVGVYPVGEHHSTNEAAASKEGWIDPYTRTKQEQEQVVRRHIKMDKAPIVMLRPGLTYGPRDRTFIPQVLDGLKRNRIPIIGDGEAVLSNTYIGNLIPAIFLALTQPNVVGDVFNIRDPRPVSRVEFLRTIAERAGYPQPTRKLSPFLAQTLTTLSEAIWGTLGMQPPLTKAKLKVLMTNLDFSIDRARAKLGYDPQIDFQQGIEKTISWFNKRSGE